MRLHLWKNTLDYRVEVGVIAKQVRDALDQLPFAKHLKLYNAGSFFDRQSIPQEDTFQIADLIEGYETLIVEAHPKIIGTSSNCFIPCRFGREQGPQCPRIPGRG